MKYIIGFVFVAAAVGFTIWGYAGYFQVEKAQLETADTSLQKARDAKAIMEQRSAEELMQAAQ
jgi:hypothetical protein